MHKRASLGWLGIGLLAAAGVATILSVEPLRDAFVVLFVDGAGTLAACF